MGEKSQSIISAARDMLGAMAATSALIFFWGYVWVQAPLKPIFGMTVPFGSEYYWVNGFSPSILVLATSVVGVTVGVTVVSRCRDLWLVVHALLSMVLGGLMLVLDKWASLAASALLFKQGLCTAVLSYALCVIIALVANHTRVLMEVDSELLELERAVKPRGNTSEVAASLEDGQSPAVILDPAASRAKGFQDRINQIRSRLRRRKLVLMAEFLTCLPLIALYLASTQDFVSGFSTNRGITKSYPLVKMVTAVEVPELGVPSNEGQFFIYSVRYILRSDDVLYLADGEWKRSLILPTSSVIRISIPSTH